LLLWKVTAGISGVLPIATAIVGGVLGHNVVLLVVGLLFVGCIVGSVAAAKLEPVSPVAWFFLGMLLFGIPFLLVGLFAKPLVFDGEQVALTRWETADARIKLTKCGVTGVQNQFYSALKEVLAQRGLRVLDDPVEHAAIPRVCGRFVKVKYSGSVPLIAHDQATIEVSGNVVMGDKAIVKLRADQTHTGGYDEHRLLTYCSKGCARQIGLKVLRSMGRVKRHQKRLQLHGKDGIANMPSHRTAESRSDASSSGR
jgi:hypothetical protein